MRQRPLRSLSQPAPRTLHMEVLEDRWNRSAVLLSEDFQSTAVRTLPLSLDTALGVTGPDAFAEVTGPGGRYPEPFGPAGNRSLVIDNPGVAQPVLAWSSEFPQDAAQFQSGTIAFDLLLAEPGNRAWTFLDVRMGYGGPTRSAPTTVGDTTIWNSFRIHANTPDVVLDQGPGGGSAAVSSVTRLRVVYDINGPQRTYRLTINGAPVLFDRGAIDRPWIAGAPGINMIAFVGATPQTSGLVFIDNLLITQDDSTSPGWSAPADEPTNRLEWHQHRGNPRLTGEAKVSENVVSGASTVWSAFVGARESWFSLTPIPQQEAMVQHPPQNVGSQAAIQEAWDLGGPYWDLAGNGQSQAVATSPLLRIGDFIPGNGVLEKLEGEVFDTTFGQGVVRLFVYHQGTWVQQWQSPTLPAMFSIPNLITGDFDHDGQLEVALTPWNDLYLLNMQTGQIEQSVRFKPAANESGRPYGWLGAYDMDGDQRSEFVLMGDFQDFITVIGWDSQGRLTKLWERVFDGRLSNKRTAHRPGLLPVMQVQGDNGLEITTSVYNETGDARWHTLVLDGRTGAPRADFADRVVDGLVDWDQDGRGELFLRTTTGSLLAERSTLEIVDWQAGQWHTRWSQPDSRFVQQAIGDFPAHVNSATSTGKRGLLHGSPQPQGPDVFFTQSLVDAPRNISVVTAWGRDAVETAQSLAVWQGPALDVLAIRTTILGIDSILVSSMQVGGTTRLAGDYNADGRVDARDFTVWQDQRGQSAVPPGSAGDGNGDGQVDDLDYDLWQAAFGTLSTHHVLLQGATARVVYSQTSAPPRTSAVVGRMAGPDSPPTVLIPGGGQTVVALTPDPDGQMRPSWNTSGWGAFFGATQNQGQHNQSGLALADVDGNGTLEGLYATRSDTGRARLVAARADGSPLWHADFDVAGGLRIFNEPGLVAWRTGHFTSTHYADVLVQLMYGIGGTGEFVLLDGRDGSVRWRRNYGNTPGSSTIQRGAGEAHLAIYDWDRDGLDEAVNFNPDMFYVLDGNGTNLIDRSIFNGGVFPGGSPLFGTPIVADFLNNQTDTLLFGGSYAQMGLITAQGTPVWSIPFVFDNTPGFLQGIGDVDGDGDLDLLSPGHPAFATNTTQSFFHAYDAATGALLWKLALPGRPHAPVGGAYNDTPTLSISGDVDADGRVESIFAIGDTLYVVGATPAGNAGTVEWTYRPDGGLLGSPILADANGDGSPEIIVVSSTGMLFGIGRAALAPSLTTSPLPLPPDNVCRPTTPPASEPPAPAVSVSQEQRDALMNRDSRDNFLSRRRGLLRRVRGF